METNRRDFLMGAAWMGAAAMAAGCVSERFSLASGGPMLGFTVPPMGKIRVGFIGIGERGTAAVRRVMLFPGVEAAALCDLRPEAVDQARQWLKENKKPGAMREYKGKDDSWKGVCDDPEVDVVYIATPADLHVRMELGAMNAGKHVMCEVPGAHTVDECWQVVETCERTRRHCMMLENCCYGETEMLAFNLCRQGLLGELTHGECGYIHNLVWRRLEDSFRNRLHHKTLGTRMGNPYPTHGLGPVCQYMGVNRGDRLDYLVSMSSNQAAMVAYARENFPEGSWQRQIKPESGDMNTTLIKTAVGRTIMMQYDCSTPRPYSRLNLIQGSKGIFADYPYRVGFTPKSGAHCEFFPEKKADEIRTRYQHPLWKTAGEVAKKVGGHGGMDFLMDLRWVYCLQNGLPLDMSVYDLASWSAVCELSEKSDRARGRTVCFPDFTRGAWKTEEPLGIVDVDLGKMGFN